MPAVLFRDYRMTFILVPVLRRVVRLAGVAHLTAVERGELLAAADDANRRTAP